MSNPWIVPFPGARRADCAEVGGKAASLMHLGAAGLPVPPGSVVTSPFFATWYRAVQASRAWARLIESPPEEWPGLCRELRELALELSTTPAQREALAALHRNLGDPGDGARFAVRSSSPEEDLSSASFAGGYESRLGVPPADLEDAVRACFASSLDHRLLTYKREHGFDVRELRIAVIVQWQVDSEVAGVAFSVSPVTNDYDEAVVAASWGLGPSVVEGRVSPDHFVVDKVRRTVVEESRGDKRLSVYLDPAGGTLEREDERARQRALTDAQLHELTDVILRTEALYGEPVDLEWAYAGGALHLLQARPITTYVPLPPEMVTAPGERRRLYGDAALSKGLTTNAPISPLGLDTMESTFFGILESWVGAVKRDVAPRDALFFSAGGRMYMNYSNLMWLASPAKLAKGAAGNDVLMAEILAGVDAKDYRAATRPPWVSFRLLWRVPRALWSLRRFFWNLLRNLLVPERGHRTYRRRVDALQSELCEQLDDGLPLADLRRTYEARVAREIFDVAMPALLAGLVRPGSVVRGMGGEASTLAERLTLGATGNVVVEMGITLYRVATLLEPSDFDDLERLAERLEARRLPPAFLKEWDDFVCRFGWRGPLETDLASPRYADDPRLALRQMSFMGGEAGETGFDPEAAHRRQVEGRRRAFEELMGRAGPLRRLLLRRVHRLIDLFAGTRDTPKHLLVLFHHAVRKRALAEGRRLTREGRLDAPEEVFTLTFDELDAASRDATLDLRALGDERMRFRGKLESAVTTFPAVIDSRGRILRPPPRDEEPGLLRGMAVSSGVATGPVKVLRSPHEKRVERGDVLVAYTTDPGWTPLFVNAAAVVLEVGSALQHGAVVARELGKPCVVGIDRAVETLHDGEPVEVDGAAGTVRRASVAAQAG